MVLICIEFYQFILQQGKRHDLQLHSELNKSLIKIPLYLSDHPAVLTESKIEIHLADGLQS